MSYGKFDGLLRGDAHKLGREATVQPQDALVTYHLLEAVHAVLVHEFTDYPARTLVLQPRLHQVDRVHRSGSRGCGGERR